MTVAQFMDYLRGFPPSAEVVIPNGDPTSDDYLVAKPHAPEEVPVARFGVIKAVVVGMEFGRVPTLRVCNPDSRRKLKRDKEGNLTGRMTVAS
jgi:hypothetical protein